MAKQDNSASTQMHEKVGGLEKWLDGIYAKAPALPVGAREWIAQNAYWLAAIGGVLGLWGAYSLWQVAQWGSRWTQYANDVANYYGTISATNAFTPVVWVTIIVAVAQSVLLLMAVGPLKAHRKNGWNFLFYSGLLNVVVAGLYLFSSSYGFGSTLGALIGCVIGFYFLFQIRSYFLPKKA